MASLPSRVVAARELRALVDDACRPGASRAELESFRLALQKFDRAVVADRLPRVQLEDIGELRRQAIDTALESLACSIEIWESTGRSTANTMRRCLEDLRLLLVATPSAALQPQGDR